MSENYKIDLRLVPIDIAINRFTGFQFQGTEEQFKDWQAEPYLQITMPCGFYSVFQHREDIPYQNTPCPCGDPTHWILQFLPSF